MDNKVVLNFNLYSPDGSDENRERQRRELPRGPQVDVGLEIVPTHDPAKEERRRRDEAVIRGGVLKIIKDNGGRFPGVFRRPEFPLE